MYNAPLLRLSFGITLYRVSQKKFTCFGGLWNKQHVTDMTKMLVSNANLDLEILFGNIPEIIDPEIRKIPEKGLNGNQDSTFHSGPSFTCY